MAFQEFLKDLRKDLEQDGIRQTAVELHDEYGIDQQEFGKIMIVASLALMIAAIPSALTLQQTHDELVEVNQDFDSVQGMMGSQDFQEGMDMLQNDIGGRIGGITTNIAEGLNNANESISQLESTEGELQQRADLYKWLSLISILGMVSGAVIIYI